jgi:predicted PurR-regulated permease PerM
MRRSAPWSTIIAVLACVTVWLVLGWFIYSSARIIAWVAVAAFFALVMAPMVQWVQRRLHVRRGLAIGIVVLAALGAVFGTAALFVVPVARQVPAFLKNLPSEIGKASAGRGAFGNLVKRFHLESFVRTNGPKLQTALDNIGKHTGDLVRSLFDTVVATATIIVLSVLMLSQGPHILKTVDENLIPTQHRDRVRRIAADAVQAVSGYMFGNLLISLVAGFAAFILLLLLGVPNAGVLAIWVAFADLIPLVGATLGAVPAIFAAFLHNSPAGVIAAVFFVVYQQFENSVLQTTVMARTVKVNPLAVLLSVLVGVELFGFLGALLAIPVAGILQVLIKAWWEYRHEDPQPAIGQ